MSSPLDWTTSPSCLLGSRARGEIVERIGGREIAETDARDLMSPRVRPRPHEGGSTHTRSLACFGSYAYRSASATAGALPIHRFGSRRRLQFLAGQRVRGLNLDKCACGMSALSFGSPRGHQVPSRTASSSRAVLARRLASRARGTAHASALRSPGHPEHRPDHDRVYPCPVPVGGAQQGCMAHDTEAVCASACPGSRVQHSERRPGLRTTQGQERRSPSIPVASRAMRRP